MQLLVDKVPPFPCKPRVLTPHPPSSSCVFLQCSAPIVASQLLLVDEVLRAGMNMRRQ